MEARELMRREVITLQEHDSLALALQLMDERHPALAGRA